MKKLLFALCICTLISSCKKDLRTKVYQLQTYDNSGVSGSLTLQETNDKTITNAHLEAWGMQPSLLYPTHIHEGVIGGLINIQVDFGKLQTTSGSVEADGKWYTPYDDALKANACFTMHKPDTMAKYVLVRNIGKNE